MLAASLGLSACSVPDWANPVGWYRDISGASADDPKADARNTQNLQKGSEDDYPNLASVPPPPTNALSSADREKLRNSLAADRANAKYVEGNDQQYVPSPPTVVPSPPKNAPEPPPPPDTAAAPAAPVQGTTQPAPTPAPKPASQTPVRGGQAPPQESSLTAPAVRGLPQGETPRSAPPPPVGSPARTQTQQASQSAPPQTAALPPPSLPPAPPPAFGGGGAALPSDLGVTLGIVQFDGNSARLSPESLAQVREVAALRQQNGGGTVRVTGYSVPLGEQDTMAPQLASFNLALDRARAVATALTQSGVPARALEIGASPPPPGQAGGTVEMSLEQ
jgi:outer membrane protein OmpA-like peptidoglycan-associated protein